MREQVGNQRLYEFHSEQHFIEPPRGWGGAAWQAPGKDAYRLGDAFEFQVRHEGNFFRLFQYSLVGWNDDADVVAKVADGAWQTACHIGQSACFYQGVGFSAGKKNIHAGNPCQ